MLLVLTTRAWWHSMGEQQNSPVCPTLWWMFGIPRGFFHLVAGELRVIQTYLPDLPGFPTPPELGGTRQIREVTLMSCYLWKPILELNPYFWGGYVRGVYVEPPWRVSCRLQSADDVRDQRWQVHFRTTTFRDKKVPSNVFNKSSYDTTFFQFAFKKVFASQKNISNSLVTFVCFWYVNIPNETSLFSKKSHQGSSWLMQQKGSTSGKRFNGGFLWVRSLRWNSGFVSRIFGNRELTFDFHDLPVGWWR